VTASGARLLGLGLAHHALLCGNVFTRLGEIARTLWLRPADMRWMDGAGRVDERGGLVSGGRMRSGGQG
jgi:hypothetical protein